jgi:hypothetical protein
MLLSRYWKWTPAALALLGCLAFSGCGSGGAPVEGTVTLDGRPVDGGTITFAPVEYGGGQQPVTAEIKGGAFSLNSAHGPPPGTYRVEIYWNKKTGRQIPSNDPPNMKDEELPMIPPQYNKDSRVTEEIKPGGNKFEYKLVSRVNDETRSPDETRRPGRN